MSRRIGTVFLKQGNDNVENCISKLQELKENLGLSPTIIKEIESEIRRLKAGVNGERNVYFELKNSGMDMYILQDIYLEGIGEEDNVQIDFLVITNKHIYVIECKNLHGNITIKKEGVFGEEIFYQNDEKYYSPIRQNKRHLDAIFKKCLSHKGAFVRYKDFEADFWETYKSLIVIANPKTTMNIENSSIEIANQFVYIDYLIERIKSLDTLKGKKMSTKKMLQIGNFLLSLNSENDFYSRLYNSIYKKVEADLDKNINRIIEKLKQFRKSKCKEENTKAFYIFTDAQLNKLIEKRPTTKEELKRIEGFGEKKAEKYGDEILEILCN